VKRARPNIKAESSAAVESASIIGKFPTRRNTVRAQVLADLLSSEEVTTIEGVFESSTTRIPAVINVLGDLYVWQIDRHDVSVGTKDGRTPEVRVYYLRQSIIRAAFEAGAAQFIKDVREQRKARRKDAPKARREAERRNIARALRRIDPTQGDFFQGVPNDQGR
jgi:hypothetical protein